MFIMKDPSMKQICKAFTADNDLVNFISSKMFQTDILKMYVVDVYVTHCSLWKDRLDRN